MIKVKRGEGLVVIRPVPSLVIQDRARINAVVRLDVALAGQIHPEVASGGVTIAGFVLAVVVVRFSVHHFPVEFVVRYVSL
jgi:hypothetical protein